MSLHSHVDICVRVYAMYVLTLNNKTRQDKLALKHR